MRENLVTFTEFSKIMGVSSARVSQVANQGKISFEVIAGRKLVDPVKAKKEWTANIKKPRTPCGGRATKKKKSAAKKADKKAAENPKIADKTGEPTKTKVVYVEPEIELPTFEGLTTADAERKEKVFRAKLSELKFLEQAKKLVEVDKVEKAAYEIARATRDALLGLPSRIAHEIAAETDPRRVELFLQKEITQALQELIKRQAND